MTRKEFSLVIHAMACLMVGEKEPALRALDLLRMQNIDTKDKPPSDVLKIGKFRIWPSKLKGKVSIYCDSDEGGDFSVLAFEKAVAAFYNDNF